MKLFEENQKTDLHMHSVYSDGTYEPCELVRKYKSEGYERIALTDHDGTGGVREALEEGKKLNIQVIRGIEFSTAYDGHEMHMLGYDFDIDNPEMCSKIAEIRQFRVERNEKLFAKLKERGYDLPFDELKAMTKDDYIGKPNIARMMVKCGYIKDVKDAFISGECLEAPEIKVIKRQRIETFDAMRLIINAGGKAVLAHPIKLKWFGRTSEKAYWDKLDYLLKELKEAGLYGMECYYPEHSAQDTLSYLDLAKKYGLEVTKGSDFHGGDLK